mmetsp:Transcript_8729/g.26234  ORF Transcript_8729/g.26234 Transcript_8729/m.26234 type:complete len:211 (-) Transcript_8729:631-1263(-)
MLNQRLATIHQFQEVEPCQSGRILNHVERCIGSEKGEAKQVLVSPDDLEPLYEPCVVHVGFEERQGPLRPNSVDHHLTGLELVHVDEGHVEQLPCKAGMVHVEQERVVRVPVVRPKYGTLLPELRGVKQIFWVSRDKVVCVQQKDVVVRRVKHRVDLRVVPGESGILDEPKADISELMHLLHQGVFPIKLVVAMEQLHRQRATGLSKTPQ